MARGLRELLNALAEDDGTLVRDVDEPIEALLRGLHAQEYELELVEAAIGLLVREGFLEADDHAIWIPDLPRAQAQREVAAMPAEHVPPAAEARQTSTERVRAFRARQRERNATGVSNGAVPQTSSDFPPVTDDVSLRVEQTGVVDGEWEAARAVVVERGGGAEEHAGRGWARAGFESTCREGAGSGSSGAEGNGGA